MSAPAHKVYPPTGVPYSTYTFCGKNLLHVNRAIKAIRRNDFKTLDLMLKTNTSIIKGGTRKPIIFYAIKYQKHNCLDTILQNDGIKHLSRAEVISWLSIYFNINVYTTWKTTVPSSSWDDLSVMLRYAVSDNYMGAKNLGKIEAMLWYGACPDKDCGYPFTTREYAVKFNVPCVHLFRDCI